MLFLHYFYRVSFIKCVEGRTIFVEIILQLYAVNNKGFWLHIRSQLQVTTEPLKLSTKTTSQYKKHRVTYLIFCY